MTRCQSGLALFECWNFPTLFYEGEGVPENSWHLVIKQEAAEHFTDPTTSGMSNDYSLDENDRLVL